VCGKDAELFIDKRGGMRNYSCWNLTLWNKVVN